MTRPPDLPFVPQPSFLVRGRDAIVAIWQFVRWVLGGPLFRPSLRFAPIGIGLWLITGMPKREPGFHPALHGPLRAIAVVVGVAIVAALFAYWQTEVRRDEPPRIRSRWDRRRG